MTVENDIASYIAFEMGRIVIIATIDLNVVPKTHLSSATPRLVLVIVGTHNGYFPLVTHYGVSAKTVLKERSFLKKIQQS